MKEIFEQLLETLNDKLLQRFLEFPDRDPSNADLFLCTEIHPDEAAYRNPKYALAVKFMEFYIMPNEWETMEYGIHPGSAWLTMGMYRGTQWQSDPALPPGESNLSRLMFAQLLVCLAEDPLNEEYFNEQYKPEDQP